MTHRDRSAAPRRSVRSSAPAALLVVAVVVAPHATVVAGEDIAPPVDPSQLPPTETTTAEQLRRQPPRGAPSVEAQAGRAVDELFILVINQPSFDRMCEATLLSNAQRSHAERAFDAYLKEIDALRQALKEALIPILVDVGKRMERTGEQPPADLQIVIDAGAEAFARVRAGLTGSLRTFEIAVREALAESQLPLFDQALETWRRAILLNPGDEPGSLKSRRDLGLHVDLLVLARSAAEKHPELHAWLGEPELGGDEAPQSWPRDQPLPQPRASLHDDVRPIFDDYVRQLDALVVELYWEDRDGYLKRMQAIIDHDIEAVERFQHASIRRWERVHRLADRTARAVADHLAAADDHAAAEAWLDAYHRTLYPTLYAPRTADTIHEWLAALPEGALTEEQRAALDAAWSAHTERRRALRLRMQAAYLDCIVRDHMEPHTVAFLRRIGDAPGRIQPITEARRELNNQYLASVRSLLNADQQAELDRRISAARAAGHEGEPLEF